MPHNLTIAQHHLESNSNYLSTLLKYQPTVSLILSKTTLSQVRIPSIHTGNTVQWCFRYTNTSISN